jgi:hypothetical protein
MATVLDICTDALVEIGVLADGEVATGDQGQGALRALARLQDQWATEKLTIFTVTKTTKALTASDNTYSVGSGSDINIVRPVFIDQINLLDTAPTPDLETPLQKLTEQEFANWPDKAAEADRPEAWYYNPTYPTGTLTLLPVQTGSYSIVLYVPTQITENTALSTTISLPPGYRRMLVKNLAVEMAPSYKVPVDPLLVSQAAESKAAVKRANIRPAELGFESGARVGNGGQWDILSDQFR